MESTRASSSARSIALLDGLHQGPERSLDRAARWLFESQLASGTVASVIADGAVRHHLAGLYQFVAIRAGADRAASIVERLEAEHTATFAKEVSEGESPEPKAVQRRARVILYRSAQALLAKEKPGRIAPDSFKWWVPAEQPLADDVLRLRKALSPEEADVLELCTSRGLSPEEGAVVLGIEESKAEELLAEALSKVDSVLAQRAQDPSARQRLLLVAFALDPRRAGGPLRPRREPVLNVGAVVHDRYEIEAPLGRGAFADVYRARDREVTDHVVALKILRRAASDPQAIRVAMRELQLIASVFHPSVVQLKDHGWHNGHLWFVMPLYRGETLTQRLQRGPLSRQEARDIFEPLAEALATMHRVGVRHQDIKPENVFLANIGSRDGAQVLPVLLDLGVAAKDVELVLAGTPAYFAPEVAARFSGMPDPPAVGPKADVFALALTLRDALDPTPRDFVAAGAVDAFVSFRAKSSPHPPFREDLKDLRPSFERWLHLSPDQRPTAEEFRQELKILTRRDEKRRRRLATLRWFVPTALATITFFGSVIYVLSREAALGRTEAREQRDRALSAQERARNIHASLAAEEALRRKLQAQVEGLESRYQNSKMTRDELAQRLARVEGELTLLDTRLAEQQTKQRRDLEELRKARHEQEELAAAVAALRDRRDELARELDRTKAALEQERKDKLAAEETASRLSARLSAVRELAAATRAHLETLGGSTAPSSARAGTSPPVPAETESPPASRP